jgi:hypothetical protein
VALRQGEVAVKFTSDGAGRVVADLTSVGQASAQAGGQLDKVGDSATRAGGSFEQLAGLAKNALLGGGLTAIATFATRSVVEFQKIEAQIVTLTGSYDAARTVIGKLREDSDRTNLNINESTQAYVRLRTQGIDPTIERLSAIGNISAQTGRSVEEVANAFGQAARGQFRQLASLGVTFREENDELVARFIDGTEQIITSSDQAVAALERVGNVDFAGAKAREAQTLAGSFDDLTQAASELAVTFGEKSGLVDNVTKSLQAITTFVGRVNDTERALRALREEASGFATAAGIIADVLGGNPGGAIEGAQRLFRGPQLTASAGGSVAPGVRIGAQGQQTAETERLSKATEELVAKLLELTEVEGKSRVETLELAKAKALAKAATDADRAAVTKAFDAYIAAAKASEARDKASRSATAASRDQAKADAEGARAAAEHARAVAQQQAALQRLLDELYDIEPATAAYREQVAELVALYQSGAIGADEFQDLLARAQDQLSDAAVNATGDPDAYRDVARDQVDAYADEWEQGLGELGNLLTDLLGDIFGRGGAEAANLLNQALGQVFQRANFRRTGDVRFDSAQLGRGFETDPNFSGPPTALANDPSTAGASNQNIGSTIVQVGAALAPELGTLLGGGGRNAQLGAQIGATLGSIAGPVGQIVGSILGGLLGGAFDDTPRITVSGNTRGQERTGRSAFGTFGASTRDTDLPVAQLIEAVTRTDNLLASFLTGAERQAATGALRSFTQSSSGDDLSVEEVLRARVAVVIRTVEPAFAPFLNAIDDIEERIRQFEGLRVIKEQIDDIDRIVVESFGTPVEQQTARLARLEEAVTKAGDALASAIDAQDLAAAAQASQDFQRAIIELAAAQIDAAVQLEQALIDLDRSARAFDLNLLQRLANLPGGDAGAVVGRLRGNIDVTRAGVLNSRTPEQSLAYLNEFIGTVDAWLERATAQVRANLQVQLQALDTERDGILGAAQARADAANAAAQQQAQFEADRNRAAIEALEEQIRLAQQWVSVLDRADGLIDAFRFGNANPIGLQSQFSNLSGEADALFAQFSAGGGNRTEIANRLLEILTQQQQVGASLFDRPSDESVALYNQILSRINAVRDVAQPEAERARQLQEQIAALQGQTVNAVNSLTDATYFLTQEERERLDEIEEERRTAEEEAQAALEEINDEAREYYEWARTTGQDLQRQQRDLVQAQLDALTGGLSVQDFIALKQSEARDALYQIRDDLRAFLDSIRVVSVVVGPGGPGGPGRGGGGGGGGDVGEGASAPSSVVVNTGDIVVTVGSGDPVEVGAAVRAVLRDELPVLATALRRELQTA